MNAMHIRKTMIAASMVAALVGATSASTAADAARCVPAGWTLASGNAGCAKNGPWLARGLSASDDALFYVQTCNHPAETWGASGNTSVWRIGGSPLFRA